MTELFKNIWETKGDSEQTLECPYCKEHFCHVDSLKVVTGSDDYVGHGIEIGQSLDIMDIRPIKDVSSAARLREPSISFSLLCEVCGRGFNHEVVFHKGMIYYGTSKNNSTDSMFDLSEDEIKKDSEIKEEDLRDLLEPNYL